MLQELQRRHQELEVTLAEERGRRKACQEMMERAAIVQREPVPRDPAPGTGRWPAPDDSQDRRRSIVDTSGAAQDCGRVGSASGERHTGDA